MDRDRRKMLSRTVGAIFMPSLSMLLRQPLRAESIATEPRSEVDANAKAAWIDEALVGANTRGTSLGALRMGRFADPFYYLTSPIQWTPDPDKDGDLPKVIVPKGFVTDLASIPRIFWASLRPDGDYAYAAILHDYLYWTQTSSRARADQVLEAVMRDFTITWVTRQAIFRAVRVGGSGAWDANGAARVNGEKRVLKMLPNDPTVRWRDWKTKAGVFV